MSRKQKPLKVISELPTDEQTEIYHLMLHNHKTYEEISDLLFERHGYRVSKNTIGRHFHRCQEDEDFEALPEIKASAGEWLHYKETGETAQFDEAALERLKLKTFQLSGTLKDQKELTQLKSLFGILFAARLAEVRERTVAVRERLATVREKTGARTSSSATPPNHQGGSNPSPNLENIEEPENPTARVVRACGGVPEFFGQVRPGERITHAIRRMWYEIEAGTFVAPPPTPETITPLGVPIGPNGEIKPETPSSAGILPASSEASSLGSSQPEPQSEARSAGIRPSGSDPASCGGVPPPPQPEPQNKLEPKPKPRPRRPWIYPQTLPVQREDLETTHDQ